MAQKGRISCFVNNLLSWRPDPRVEEKMKNTCFAPYLEIKDKVDKDLDLITYLIRSYDERSTCFVFQNFSLFLGLEDIYFLTGLPVDGLPVTGKIISVEKAAQYLGVRADVGFFSARTINLSKLRAHFKAMPMDSEESIMYATRAYILYLLGSFFFSSTSSNIVLFAYLPFLEDLNKVNDYAWGAAVLAYIHVNFRAFNNKDQSNVGGFLYMLMLFVFERVPAIRESYFRTINCTLPSKFPLIVEWTSVLAPLHNRRANLPKDLYIRKFSEITEADVVWRPYNHRFRSLPQNYVAHLEMGCCSVVVLHFKDFSYHLPENALQQFGFERAAALPRYRRYNFRMQRDRQPVNSDWSKHAKYVPLVSHWAYRKHYLIGRPTVSLIVDEPTEEQMPMEVESSLNQNQANMVDTPAPFLDQPLIETPQPSENQWGIGTSQPPIDTSHPFDDQRGI